MKMKCTAILCLRHINVRKPLWRHRLGERKGIMNSWNETGKVWGQKFNAWRLPKILFKAHKGESTQYQETLIYCNLFGWEQRRTGNWTASFLVSGPVWVCNLCRTSSQFTAGLQNNLSSNAGQSISPFHAILCTKEKKKKVGGVTHQKARLERCYLHLCVAPSKLLIKDSFSPSSQGLLIPLGDENITTSLPL